MRPYNFHVELSALRERLSQEHSLDYKYLPSKYVNIRPIQILLDKFLHETIDDLDRRKEIRLAMLSLWVEKRVETTYDLTVYQCSEIPNFLELNEDWSYGERTRRFLSDSQAFAEGHPVPGESDYFPIYNQEPPGPVRLSDL